MLTDKQISVLQRGLSFSPTNTCDTFNLDIDLQRFFRNLRLKRHFAKLPNLQDQTLCNQGLGHSQLSLKQTGLRKKSTFVPPNNDNVIEAYIKLVNNDIEVLKNKIKRKPLMGQKPNLSYAERKCLNDLLTNEKLIFKPADKGGALVVLNKQYYVDEIMSQLSDKDVYKKVSTDPLTSIQQCILDKVVTACEEGIIDENHIS